MNAQDMNYGGRFHMDDRGIRYCDIFPEIEKGDINVSIIEPGAAALWHRHENQDDYQFVIKGSLKVGVCNAPYMDGDDLAGYGMPEELAATYYEKREEALKSWQDLYKRVEKPPILNTWPEDTGEVNWHYLSDRNAKDGPLYIPRYLWHGCVNYTNEPAILIYHITNQYDPEDEHRMEPLVAGWPYERVIK